MLIGKLLYPIRKSAGHMLDILGSNGTLFKSLHNEFRQKSRSIIVKPVSLERLCHNFLILFMLDSTMLLLCPPDGEMFCEESKTNNLTSSPFPPSYLANSPIDFSWDTLSVWM